jgi:AbrB family looped-hinge helix DNA binding protein
MTKLLDSKVSAEGRVSIPSGIRHRLGLQPGDRVQFLVDDDGDVRLVTARSLAAEVWARNTGGDTVDTGTVVREAREADERANRLDDDEPFDTAPSSGDDVLAALFPEA